MRALLGEILLAVLAAVVLVLAVTAGGVLAIVAGVSAAVFALSLRTLWAAFLESLEPRTRHEKRAMQRITESALSNMAKLRVQQQAQAARTMANRGGAA